MLWVGRYLASEIITGSNTQLGTVTGVVRNAGLNGLGVGAVTFEAAVDGSDGGAEALVDDGAHVLHPVPESRLEGHHGVVPHRFRRIEAVEADGLPGRAIVEVPRQLDGPSPEVPFVGGAWVLCVALVTVILRRTVYLFYVAKICTYVYMLIHVFISIVLS